MKYLKIFALAVSAFAMTACDDDVTSWNTAGDVTVEMGQPTVRAKEGRGLITVPVVVNGNANGNIMVTLGIEEGTAKENEHLYFTTQSVVISPEDKTYNFEVTILDDDIINENRVCTIKIESAEGAKIGAQSTTELTIRDNDADFYDKLTGVWELVTEEGDKMAINLVGYDEDEPGYNRFYTLEGLGQGLLSYQLDYYYDLTSNTGYLELTYGQVGGQVNFTGLGVCDVTFYGYDGSYYYSQGAARLTWNADMTELMIDPNSEPQGWMLGVEQNGSFMGYWDAFFVKSIKRASK